MDIYVPERTINTWNINRYTYSFQAGKNDTMRTGGVYPNLNYFTCFIVVDGAGIIIMVAGKFLVIFCFLGFQGAGGIH